MRRLYRGLCLFLTGIMVMLQTATWLPLSVPETAQAAKKVTLTPQKVRVAVGKTKKLKLKNNKKKVTWTVISGKKYVTLKSKKKTGVTVRGKKAGKAKIQAKAGGRKYTCQVIVVKKSAVPSTPTPERNEPTSTPASINSGPASPTAAPGNHEPISTPAGSEPTSPTLAPGNKEPTPAPDEVLTLHYNNDNAEEVKAQIRLSTVPVYVIVEDGVTSIGNSEFYDCRSLTGIEMPESVTSIGEQAFGYCDSLARIKISGNVTGIGDFAFYNCSSLTEIEIPGSVTDIGDYAFGYCEKLTEIEIPGSVTDIGLNVFLACHSLTVMNVSEDNEVYDSRGNCNAIIETKTGTLIQGCNGTVIPDGVTGIGDNAFRYRSGLTDIKIPSSVTSIGNMAFLDCSGLTGIEIPSGVTSIGDGAFAFCSGLASVEIPSSVTSIGDDVFAFCSRLTEIRWNGRTYDSVEEFLEAFEAFF